MKRIKKLLLTVLSVVMLASCAFGAAGCSIGGGSQNNANDAESEFKTAYALYVTYAEANGQTPSSYEDWLATIKGEKGEDGKSAYQIWLDNGYTGTQSDFLEWLRGAAGEKGADGKSAIKFGWITVIRARKRTF